MWMERGRSGGDNGRTMLGKRGLMVLLEVRLLFFMVLVKSRRGTQRRSDFFGCSWSDVNDFGRSGRIKNCRS